MYETYEQTMNKVLQHLFNLLQSREKEPEKISDLVIEVDVDGTCYNAQLNAIGIIEDDKAIVIKCTVVK